MIADKFNTDLALDAYKTWENNSITKDKLVGNDKFKVLAVEDNKNNGMQVMAVVQVRSKYKTNRDFVKLNKQIKRV